MQPLQFQPLIWKDSDSTKINLCLSKRTYRTVFFVVHCMQRRTVFFDHVYKRERVEFSTYKDTWSTKILNCCFCFLQSASCSIQFQILCSTWHASSLHWLVCERDCAASWIISRCSCAPSTWLDEGTENRVASSKPCARWSGHSISKEQSTEAAQCAQKKGTRAAGASGCWWWKW